MKGKTGGKRGFTIIELMVVIAIIGVLVTIVSVAVGGVMKSGRAKRATAMCNVLEQAIAMYYTKTGKWPNAIESVANNVAGDEDKITLSPDDADRVFREIVEKSTGSGATMSLVDASGLYVANSQKLKNSREGCYDNHSDNTLSSFCGDQKCVGGANFSEVARSGSRGHIPLSNMAFGYQATGSGKFSRFWITYNTKTDEVTVSRKNPSKKYPEDWE